MLRSINGWEFDRLGIDRETVSDMSTRQHVNPSTCLPVNMSILLLSVDLSIRVPISLSTCRSAYYLDLSIYQPVYPSIRLSLDLSILLLLSLPTCRSVYSSIYQPVYPSICLSIYLSACLLFDLSTICLSVYYSACLLVQPPFCQPVYSSIFTPINRPVVIYLLNYKRCSLFFIIRVYCHSLVPVFFLPENCL